MTSAGLTCMDRALSTTKVVEAGLTPERVRLPGQVNILDEIDEVLGDLVGGERRLTKLHHVLGDMVLEGLRREAVDAAADVARSMGISAQSALPVRELSMASTSR